MVQKIKEETKGISLLEPVHAAAYRKLLAKCRAAKEDLQRGAPTLFGKNKNKE